MTFKVYTTPLNLKSYDFSRVLSLEFKTFTPSFSFSPTFFSRYKTSSYSPNLSMHFWSYYTVHLHRKILYFVVFYFNLYLPICLIPLSVNVFLMFLQLLMIASFLFMFWLSRCFYYHFYFRYLFFQRNNYFG